MAETNPITTAGETVINSRVDKKATQKRIDFGLLFAGDNVREPESYDVPSMVGSLRMSGYKPNHPLVVSAKPDGRFLVLVGNRRHAGLSFLQDQDKQCFASVLPDGKVPCVVYNGLTALEESMLRIDHGSAEDRKKLNDWELFIAVRQLSLLGMGQSNIAVHLNLLDARAKPRRPWVQVRVNLASLPPEVQAEFKLLWTKGTDATKVRVPDISKLFTVWNEEFAEYKGAWGPKFKAAWELIVNPTAGGPPTAEKKPLTPTEATKFAQLAGSNTMKGIMLAATDPDKATLVSFDASLQRMEQAVEVLAKIEQYLGKEDFADLVRKAMAPPSDQPEQADPAPTATAE